MSRHRTLQRIIALLVIVSLLIGPAAPFARAQDAGPGRVFLPVVAGGATPATSVGLLFRTHVTVKTSAQWRDLARLGVVVLQQGDDWALLLADDDQLASLAAWRFNPQRTSDLGGLAAANGLRDASLNALLAQAAELQQLVAAETAAETNPDATLDAARADLRAAMHSLPAGVQAGLVTAVAPDADGDGLTDTQELFWCTDPAVANSDFSGANDGAEVAALMAWMNNETAGFPASGKPFLGWPPQKTNCFDDDQDSVPDLAEINELGLSASRESTDRDKFDDGQELFGLTYCTGQGGFCSYGPLPRNEDWGIIFAEMPSWVKAPGNHPLVAAFPVPEIDVVESSLHMETVMVVTTDHVITVGTEKSYSTAKTEGTSTSVANTVSWNEWQEVAESLEQQAPMVVVANQSSPQSPDDFSWGKFLLGSAKIIGGAGTAIAGCAGGVALSGTIVGIPAGALACGGSIAAGIGIAADGIDDLASLDDTQTTIHMNQYQTTNVRLNNQINNSVDVILNQSFDTSNLTAAIEGNRLAQIQTGQILNQRLVQIAAAISAPRLTTTNSRGRSWGGAQTTTNEQYEEHTITNGEAFSTEESWGTATAVDSAHAADFWFTYKVRNTGNEYAREIADLAFNLYIGDDPNPAYTYFVAPDIGGSGKFQNFMPNEEHTYTSRRIPLSLEQMKAIDLGGPIRIVVEDFTYGIDELFYQDAANAGVLIAMEDGMDDGDELIDTYLIPTWTPGETVLNVLARYFPHTTDANGMMTAIWTPEYRSDTPAWCQAGWRPSDYPAKVLWCKHELSTAEWWNVYTDGLGDGSEGFQDTPASPGSVALFRFNQDSDLDGFSDRSEERLGTDANDATSSPRPELLAGLHNIKVGSRVTSTLSLLNTGFYDAYGVEAVMVAPDDSVSIENNTVGGSGRVRAQKQVIVGSRIVAQSPLPAPWTQPNHAVPAAGGYYTGDADRAYTFTVANCPTGGCAVGAGAWTLNWNDGTGASGSFNFGAGYASPTFLPVGAFGVTLALYSGNVNNGDSFTVAANTPRDTFQYTINRTPYSEPLVIVSYNDPQGNHRFALPASAMNLTAPTDNLQSLAGQMLNDVGVEIVTEQPFAPGSNTLDLLVNNPSDKTLVDAHLFLEFINISGTVVSEVPTQTTLPPGPTYTPVTWSTADFDPAFDPDQDYIVMAFLTDYQGNILDTAGRPLSSFQEDPLPELAVDGATLTWDFGSAAQGSLLKHPLALANVGYGALYAYMQPAPGLHLSRGVNASLGAADQSDFELILRAAEIAVGPYDQTVTIHTSDPLSPTVTVRVLGQVTAASGDTAGGSSRPLDVPVTATGPKNQGEWVEFTHTLGPDAQTLHPVKVYSQDYATLYGVGKYATDFGQGTASYDMFGDGRDGVMPGSGNLDNNNGAGIAIVNSGSAGSTSINVTDAYAGGRINPGDVVLIHQTQGTGAGCWELNKALSDYAGGTTTIQLAKPLQCNYSNGGNNHAQVLRVPQYSTCNVTGTVTPLAAWNGAWGGIFAVMCSESMTVSGTIDISQTGFRGGQPNCVGCSGGNQGEGHLGVGNSSTTANGNGGGGGGSDPSPWGGSGSASGGGGGGLSTVGSDGERANNTTPGTGGQAVGNTQMTAVYFGGGGGAGGSGDSSGQIGGTGAPGGGIAIMLAKQISVQGAVRSNGGNSASVSGRGAGGGGAGGSVVIRGSQTQVNIDRITAIGGVGGQSNDGNGGSGSNGRIRIEYCETISGTTNPGASTQKLNCYVVEQVESAPHTTGRLNLPENVTDSKTYQVQYGRKLNFTGASTQTATVRVPAGMLTTATLDALVSQLPANAGFSLDIGADGSNEWTASVANNSTTASPNLAAAFNAWWQSHGAPTTGSLDVPVKVTLDQAGQVLLTNLQVTTAGSKLRSVRLPAQNYSTVNLDFTVGGSETSPLTAALDVGGDGSIDWSGAAASLPFTFKTGNLAAAVNAYLATLPPPSGGDGEGYDVPIRVHVSPDASVTLGDYTTAVTTVSDLTANSISVPPSAAGQASSLASAADATALSSYRAGDIAPVTATLGNTGNRDSGPVTAAFFATAEGWGDWYIGSDFFANIPADGSVQAEIAWDTTGFSGTTPVKVVVNPYSRVAESDSGDNVKTTTVYIEPPPVPPVASFDWSPHAGAYPLTVIFTDTSQGEVAAWQWSFGDGATSSTRHPTHTYSATGLYTVTLTVTGPQESDTLVRANAVAVSVPPPPVANFSANPTAGSAPLNVQFNDLSTGQISSRQWSFGDGATSSEVSPMHTYTASGSYTATLSVSGPGGASSKSVGITVSPAQVSVSIPLTVGWNLISLPNVAANTPVETVFAPIAGKFSIVFAYKGCDASNPFDPWKKYAPTAPSFSNDLKTVDNTLGLWIEMTQAATLTVVGPPPTGGSMPLCVGQNDGWNLVGYPALQTAPPATLFAPILGCLDIVFAYRGMDADHWKKYDPAALPFSNDLTQVAPGDGLWVRVTQACTWTVNGP